MDFDATRSAFSGLIDKPQLTDTLLGRPPFKFILDVVSNTISKTGYLKSQFPKDELEAGKLTDKNAKTAFLDKLISALDDGSLGDVKSAKIVAGKEPEQTNLLLLKLAENARVHMGSTTKERRGSKVKEEKTSSKSSSKEKKDKEKPKEDKKEKDRDRSKSKSRKDGEEKEKTEKKSSSRSKSKDPKEEKSSSKSSKERSSSKEPKVKENKSSEKEKKDKKDKKDHEKKKEKKEKVIKTLPHEEEKENVTRMERRLSRSELSNDLPGDLDEGFSDRHHEEITRSPMNLSPAKTDDSGISDLVDSPHRAPPTEPPLRPPEDRDMPRSSTAAARPQTSMGRPGTAAARPAPPKIKKKHIATIEEQVIQAVEPTTVILSESMNDAAQSAENDFMIEEQAHEEPPAPFEPSLTEIPNEVGGLVKKMMETKAGIEEGNVLDEADETSDDLTKEKAKIDNLQKMLQNVTKNTYPLARLFDFAQEDLESMMRELEKWRAETRAIETELKDREASEFGESNKLSNVLSNIETEIRDVKAQLAATKGRIAGNEEKITGILAGV